MAFSNRTGKVIKTKTIAKWMSCNVEKLVILIANNKGTRRVTEQFNHY